MFFKINNYFLSWGDRLKIKIAHCADVHLGGRNIGAKNAEIKASFFEILDICQSEMVEFLLVSGDLFDNVNVAKFEVEEIISKFSQCNFKIIISPGNHDPYTNDSPYCKFTWPDNVIVFKNDYIESIEFQDKNIRVWGSAFQAAFMQDKLLDNFKILPDNYINIAVLHADLNAAVNSCYCPISSNNLSLSGFDYVALGHIHKRSEIAKINQTNYAYCGCPQGQDFGETGDKGFYIGEVDKNYCNLQFKSVCRRRYEIVSLDISDVQNQEEIINLIEQNLQALYGKQYADNYYRIKLIGHISADFVLDIEYLQEFLQNTLFKVELADETEVLITEQELSMKHDFKSVFAKIMLKKIKNSKNEKERMVNMQALKIGLMAFNKGVKYIDN